jgi:hypothetical protein
LPLNAPTAAQAQINPKATRKRPVNKTTPKITSHAQEKPMSLIRDHAYDIKLKIQIPPSKRGIEIADRTIPALAPLIVT